MSDFYTASNENSNHNTDKKSAKKIEKGLKKLLIIAAIIFIAQLVWLFGISPFIPFSDIEVHGITGLSRSEILYLSKIDETSSFISTDAKEIKRILSSHILVESAVVIKRFPDKLSIFLTVREPAAIAITSINSKQVPLYIDREGVIFKMGGDELPESKLPVISGIDNPQLNMRLPVSLIPLVENINKMAHNSPELLSVISEIKIERKVWDGFDLVLYPVHSSIKVRIENNLTEDVLRYMLLMLNVFDGQSEKPNEIDFRSGVGSYTAKEQSL
ncbi:MAG: FtsQ-type POTRA domain-containing protein [Treponema sp.]|nr:FtsQ-type POTRA domain-containing protein [Treponema sp.]MCL2250991.1 FtsQ-type POTRA domain-containing protein [Treponema sp.]